MTHVALTDVSGLEYIQPGPSGAPIFIWKHFVVEGFCSSFPQESQATNTDHLTTVLCLRLAILSSLQSSETTILCLQKLISLHPLNPWSWCQLAEAYLNPGPDLPALRVSLQGHKSSVPSDKAVSPSSVHSGTGSLLSFPTTLHESALFSVQASGCTTQKAEEALKKMQNCLATRREEAQMEARRKACAALIRAR